MMYVIDNKHRVPYWIDLGWVSSVARCFQYSWRHEYARVKDSGHFHSWCIHARRNAGCSSSARCSWHDSRNIVSLGNSFISLFWSCVSVSGPSRKEKDHREDPRLYINTVSLWTISTQAFFGFIWECAECTLFCISVRSAGVRQITHSICSPREHVDQWL